MTLVDEAVAGAPQDSEQPIGGPKPTFEGPKRRGEQFMLYTFVVVPFAAFLGVIPVAWGWGIGWVDLALMIVFYTVAVLGVTVGFHRMFTHGSFKAKRGLRVGLAVAGSLAIEGPIIRWVADHRRHHAFSDREGDPHSPWRYGETTGALLKGLCYAHVGWLFALGARFPAHPGADRRAGHLVMDGRGDRLLLGVPGANLRAPPRHLVDQLHLPHDRRAALRGPRQERQLLAAGDPVDG